jgi:hypothetical protein
MPSPRHRRQQDPTHHEGAGVSFRGSTDPRDHTGITPARYGGIYRVLCNCGWQTAEWNLKSQAEDKHAHHVDVQSADRKEAP